MKIFTWGLIISVLILILYLTWFKGDLPENIQKVDLKKEKPIILHNPELFDFAENRLTMQVKAKTASIYENRNLTLLTLIDGNVYSKDKAEKPTRIFSNSGRIEGNEKRLTVWGNVQVVFSDGQQLFTEKLNLDRMKEMLYNEEAVRMISNLDEMTADRMQYNIKTGILTLSAPKALIEIGH
ncbi:MAG: LPS export ABC transporter periplasmic protein LptC [SAR324 cluster bacterium]|nr:LPS export ABC transporter periplasmic protein LptC [SAR324 cluster bacterium]